MGYPEKCYKFYKKRMKKSAEVRHLSAAIVLFYYAALTVISFLIYF